jgi:hypothetical protein
MFTEAIIPLLSATFGGVAVALLNYLFNKKRTEVEIERITAETDKIRVETRNMGSSVKSVKSEQEQQENAIREIQRFLVGHLISKHERGHLERFVTREYWPFKNDATTKFFVEELRNLRSMGLIMGQPNKGIRSLLKEGGDINSHFKIRHEGNEYLQLLSKSNYSEDNR